MEIFTLVVGIFETNCYLAYDPSAGEGVIIDPGDEADRVMAEIDRSGFKPSLILLTHGHADHIGAVPELIARYKIPLYAGKGEEKLLRSAAQNMSALFGSPVVLNSPDKSLVDGDLVTLGSTELRVLATPGHSPGGVCYLADGVVFCGDTLFCGSIGRTDFPGCTHGQLIKSIKDKLLPLPDETVCYPGHGPATTIGEERRRNPFLIGGILD